MIPQLTGYLIIESLIQLLTLKSLEPVNFKLKISKTSKISYWERFSMIARLQNDSGVRRTPRGHLVAWHDQARARPKLNLTWHEYGTSTTTWYEVRQNFIGTARPGTGNDQSSFWHGTTGHEARPRTHGTRNDRHGHDQARGRSADPCYIRRLFTVKTQHLTNIFDVETVEEV